MPLDLVDANTQRRLALLEAGSAIPTTVATTIPRGVVGVHTLATNFTTSATHTTLQDEGLTLTASETAGRRWRWTLGMNLRNTGGANPISIRLLRDGVAMNTWQVPNEALSAANTHGITFTYVETIATTHAGSVFKVQIAAATNNTAVDDFGAAGTVRQLIIEDIGT